MVGAGHLQIGIISKPHGISGALNLQVTPGMAERIMEDSPLFIEIDGQRIPFYIEEILLADNDHLIVKLEFIDAIESAGNYTGCKIYIESEDTVGVQVTDLEKLLGYTAVDETKNFRATVKDFFEQNQNRILVLDFDGKEIMVPVADEVLTLVDHTRKIIQLNLPEGLIALNE